MMSERMECIYFCFSSDVILVSCRCIISDKGNSVLRIYVEEQNHRISFYNCK